MKIVHICQYYNDGYGYQENLLPKYQAKLGHEVVVVTSDRNSYFNGAKKPKIVGTGQYTDNGVRVIRLGISNEFKGRYVRFVNLYSVLERERPDYIFHHGIVSPSVFEIIRYKRKYPVTKIAIDNHGDYANSGRNVFWRFLYYRTYWKNKLKKIHSKVDRYFSITPNCKTFAEKEFGVPCEKHTLLLLGVDEETIYFSPEWREKIRKQYGVQDTDLAIITIGKLDEKKKVEVLIDAIKRINNKRIKLFIVGSFQKEYEIVIDSLIGEATEFIKTGWVEQNQVFKYLSAADLAVFPGGQSVLWQQAISTGLPIILKHWQEIEYIKINDDIHFLYTSNAEELEKMIQTLYHRFIYTNTNLRLNKIGVLSYREIAHISIESVYHTSR